MAAHAKEECHEGAEESGAEEQHSDINLSSNNAIERNKWHTDRPSVRRYADNKFVELALIPSHIIYIEFSGQVLMEILSTRIDAGTKKRNKGRE